MGRTPNIVPHSTSLHAEMLKQPQEAHDLTQKNVLDTSPNHLPLHTKDGKEIPDEIWLK